MMTACSGSPPLRDDRPVTASATRSRALWLVFTFGPGTPLINEDATPEARLTPFYQSLVAGFFLLFLLYTTRGRRGRKAHADVR